MANFLLDSRHILNYWATFYFKLTNKEISHPTPFHIFLGRLMLPPFCSGCTFPESWSGAGWGLKSCLSHYSLSVFLCFSLSLLLPVCLSVSVSLLICPDKNTNITLNQMPCLYAHLKKNHIQLFAFPYIKINGKHFANVKCYIKGKIWRTLDT